MRRRSSSSLAPSPPTAAARVSRQPGAGAARARPPRRRRRPARAGDCARRTMGRRIAASPTCWRSRANSTRAAGTMNGRWRSIRGFWRRATGWPTCCLPARPPGGCRGPLPAGPGGHDRTPPRPTAISASRWRRKADGTTRRSSISARSRSSRSSSTSTETSAGCCWRGVTPPRHSRSPGAGCDPGDRGAKILLRAMRQGPAIHPRRRRGARRSSRVFLPARWRKAGPVPASLSAPAAGLFKSSDSGRAAIERVTAAWPRRLSAPELWGPDGLAAVSRDRLLRALLESAPVHDVELERLLTAPVSPCWSRRRSRDASRRDHRSRRFCTARWRASASSTNTSLPDTDADSRRSRRLRERIDAALGVGASVPPLWLVAIGRLCPAPFACAAPSAASGRWPDAIARLARPAGAASRRSERAYRGRDPGADRDRRRGFAQGPQPVRGDALSALGQGRAARQADGHRLVLAQPISGRGVPAGPATRHPRRPDRRLRHRPARDRNRAAVRAAPGSWPSISAWPASATRSARRASSACATSNMRRPTSSISARSTALRPHRVERRAASPRRSVGRAGACCFHCCGPAGSCISASTARSRGATSLPRAQFIAERGYSGDRRRHPAVPAGADVLRRRPRRSRTSPATAISSPPANAAT